MSKVNPEPGFGGMELKSQNELAGELADRARLCYSIPPLSRIFLKEFGRDAEFTVEDLKNGRKTLLQMKNPSCPREEIEAQLQWMQEIRKNSPLIVPEPISGLNGHMVQPIELPDGQMWHCVMFMHLAGDSLKGGAESDPGAVFRRLGETAALLHQSGIQWKRPSSFRLPAPEYEPFLAEGGSPFPPCFSDLPEEALFRETLGGIRQRLRRYGKSGRRYGLIHGNLTPENVLLFRNRITVTHFERCCFGWYLYDGACALDRLPAGTSPVTEAWLSGYRKIRNLTGEDRAEFPTFLLLHRFVLLGRLDTQELSPENRALMAQTAELCRRYLRR